MIEIGNSAEQILKILRIPTKDHNGQTGRGRKVCKFYRELDSILGHQPASVPAVLLDTGTTSNSSSTIENHQGPIVLKEEIETNGSNILYINLTRSYILLSHQQIPHRATKNLGMKQVYICQACSICVLNNYVHSHTHTNTHVHTPLAPPPTKNQRKSRAERTMEKAMETFMAYQHEAEERYQMKRKDDRKRLNWKKREGKKIKNTS